MNTLQRKIAAVLAREGISQNQLARECGVSTAYLSLIAQRKRQPSLPVALRLQARTGIPVEAFATAKPTKRRVA